jgi:hypothetical protein
VSADSASSISSCPGPRIKYLAPSPLPPHPQVRCQPSITIPATSPNAAGSLPVANCVTLSDSRSAGAEWLTSPRLRCRPVARAATVPSRGNPRQGHQPHRPVFAARPRRRGDRISGRPPCLLGVKSGHLGMPGFVSPLPQERTCSEFSRNVRRCQKRMLWRWRRA